MLILESPWTRQPHGPVGVDWSNPLTRGLSAFWVGSNPSITGVTNETTVRVLFPTLGVGPGGRMVAGSGDGAKDGLRLVADADSILETDRCTIALVRRFKDTTLRAASAFGWSTIASALDRIQAHAPYSDGKVYWDFGSVTSGSGRLVSGVITKTTNIEAWIFIAGPNKGREIWRNGQLIASNASDTTTRPSTSSGFHLLASGQESATPITDNEEQYCLLTLRREWSNAECVAWSRNPWQLFAPQQIIIPTPAAAGYTHPTLSLATATEITATSFKPSVTYTFA